ncbi:MAG: cation transporter [Bradyrhizobium sp.]|nr:cation transporter [Bradyrhizobium sp.]
MSNSDSSHDHAHDGSHAHGHAPKSFGMAFAIGVTLNLGFVVAETIFGVLSNSTALLADAGHNLGDVLGLLVAWAAVGLSKRAPSRQFTYGLHGSSILAALFNAAFLFVAIGAIGWEAVQRFSNPEPVAGATVMAVAATGILINGATAWLFASGRKGDINIKSAFLHMAADAVVSAGVVVGAFVIIYTRWLWIDPLISVVICGVILWSSWGLLRTSVQMSLNAVPEHIDAAAVRKFLEDRPGVAQIHDLHIWPISTTETALTCHLVIPGGHPGDAFLLQAVHQLKHDFAIGHATFQIEISEGSARELAPESVI